MNKQANASAKSNVGKTQAYAPHLPVPMVQAARASVVLKSMFTFLVLGVSGWTIAQTVQLHYSGKSQKIIIAVAESNKILSNPEFYSRINNIQQFDNSTYNGLQVSNEIKNLNKTIEIEGYWNPFGIANAKTVTVVRLNTAKLRRSNGSLINTIVHETVHAVDFCTNKVLDYTHDGNKSKGQENTAPWVIGAIAENLAR